LWYFVANIAISVMSWAVGMQVVRAIEAEMDVRVALYDQRASSLPLIILSLGIAPGVIAGITQWLLSRRVQHPIWWTLASIIGWMTGATIFLLLINQNYYVDIENATLNATLCGVFAGVITSIIQWYMHGPRIVSLTSWILVNGLGYAIGWGLYVFIYLQDITYY
jgi:hypothetical protein